jgi:hypothetical protein
MGVPGRIVRAVDAALTQRIEATWRHYVMQGERHAKGEWRRA